MPPDPPPRRRGRVADKLYVGWPERPRSVRERKWRAWIGFQLRAWRLADGFVLRGVAAVTGLKEHSLSEIESGRRGLDVVELAKLAAFYGRGPEDIVRLFTPPTPEQWLAVRRRFGQESQFANPPSMFPSAPPLPGPSLGPSPGPPAF